MSPGRGCKAGETPVMESKGPAVPLHGPLHGFVVCERETGLPVDLVAWQGDQSIMVKGHLIGPADGTSMAACSGPITDWVIEYSASPCIWVCTTEAWYKLASPAAEYAATFSGAQRRLDLCTRVAAVLASKPYASLEQALPQILMHWQPASAPGLATGTGEVAGVRESGDLQQHPHHQHQDLKGRGPQGYTLDDLHAEAGFICSQLRTLLKKQKQGPALYPLLAELLNLGMPAEYGDSDDAEDDAMVCDGDEGKAACVAAVAAQKSKRWHWRKERAALEREARATNKRVDLARGNPPPPCTNFRLSHDMVPELLMIWEMIMAFSHLLQLPPIALESLEAAIMPGPLPKAKPPHPPVAAPPAGLGGSDDEEEATFGLGGPTGAADEHEFAGLGNTPRVDWAAAGRRPPGEEEWGGRVQYDLATLLDPEAGASALVLRDVHSALIKIIEGFSPKFLPDPPERARMAAEDNKSETWQECTWKTILDPKAPQELIQTGAKEAAELLKGTAEYTCLQPRQRLLILRSLLELALNSEVMRDYALQKAELISSSLPKDVTDLLPADPSDDLTELHAAQSRGAAGVPSINGWEAASPDVWLCWLQGCRVGVRRPLGTDFRKRRYWAFGGRAGCWRVFVEAPQGGGWGWYEGAALSELLDWLRAGQGLEAEAPLLRALQAMPLPMKHSEDPVPPYPLPLPPPPQGSSQPTIPWTPQDLQARRPDGYKLLAAPMLRGEYHQVLPSYGKVFNTQERILNCCQALLSELDFENRNKPWAPRIARLLCGFEARGAAGQAQGVLEVEAMLSEAGLLAPVWTGTQLQDVWRRSLSRPGLNFRDIAMHLHALQRFCRPPAPTTHPTRYHFMRHVTHLRCPVNFPSLNEPLVCLRAGCMANLDKFLDKHPKLDHPGSEVAQARQSIADLPPVQRVKIVCLGYRNYPGPNNAAPPWDNHSLKVKIEDGNHTQGAVKLEGGLEDGVKLEGQGWHEATHTTGRPGSSPFEAAQQGGSGAKLVCLGGDVHEQGHTHTHALHPPRPHSHSQQTPLPQGSGRPPCMWMVLQRMRQAEGQAPEEWVPEEGRDPVVLPIHVDASLPEFVLRPAVLEAALAKPWRVGSRVRYHHPGAKAGAKAGGAWIKGTVHHNSLLEPQLAQGGAQHDPWGSIHVVWDLKDGGTQGRVNPWELEQDPDELRRQEEERRKAEEAAARAQRAEAKGRRAGSIRIREEYLDFPSDDISSGPSEEDEDSDDSYGNRRKKNRKKPAKGARASSQQLQHQQQQQQQQQQAALLQQQQQQMLQRQPTSNAAAQLQANVVHQFRQVRDRLSQYSVVYTSMHQKGQASTPQAMQVYQALQHLQASLQSLQHQVVQVYGQHGTTMLKQLLGESAPRTQMAALAASNLTPAQQQQLLLQRQQQQQQQQQQQLTQQQLVQQQLAQQQQQQQLAHAARMQQQQLQQQRQAQLIRLQQQQQQQQQGSMYPQGLVSQGMVPQSQGLVSQGMVPQSQGLVSQGMVPQSQDFVPHSMVPQSQGLVSQGMMPKSQGLVPQSMVPQPQGFLGGPQSVLGPPQSMLPQASTAMLTPMQLIQLQQQRKQQQQQQAGTVAAHPQPQQQQMMPQSSPQPMALTPMQYQQMLLQQQQQQQQ